MTFKCFPESLFGIGSCRALAALRTGSELGRVPHLYPYFQVECPVGTFFNYFIGFSIYDNGLTFWLNDGSMYLQWRPNLLCSIPC